MKKEKEIIKTIERLKTEKIEAEKAYFDKGKEEGYIWCIDAPYLELRRTSPILGQH